MKSTLSAALWTFASAAASAGPLPTEVELALDRAQVPKESFVAVVQEVGGGSARLAWQPQQQVNPASLMKVLTTTAALDLLGPAWTWNTPVWLQGRTLNGVLDGNLVIKGTGDPKLVQERLWLMLRRVQQLGVHEIRGDIVFDRSAFNVPEQDPGAFDGEPLKPYNVRPDALLLNYKSVLLTFTPDLARGVAIVSSEPPMSGVRVDLSVPLVSGPCEDWRGALKADFSDPLRMRFPGHYAATCGEQQWPVAYAEPRSYNARMLAGLWREMGNKLVGRGRDGVAPTDPPTFTLTSPTLGEVVREINKFSNNVMAQQLFLTLGATQRGSGTPENARAVVKQWLSDRHGDAAKGVVVDNGSGLSRDGRLTAALLARVLQSAYASPVMPELMSSLPVSGIDGTMRRQRNSVPGRAHLKTGSLRDVVGIAGYVLAPSGQRYVVVGIVNHPNAGAARPALEALVTWTANEMPSMAVTPAAASAAVPVAAPLTLPPPTIPAPAASAASAG